MWAHFGALGTSIYTLTGVALFLPMASMFYRNPRVLAGLTNYYNRKNKTYRMRENKNVVLFDSFRSRQKKPN